MWQIHSIAEVSFFRDFLITSNPIRTITYIIHVHSNTINTSNQILLYLLVVTLTLIPRGCCWYIPLGHFIHNIYFLVCMYVKYTLYIYIELTLFFYSQYLWKTPCDFSVWFCSPCDPLLSLNLSQVWLFSNNGLVSSKVVCFWRCKPPVCLRNVQMKF